LRRLLALAAQICRNFGSTVARMRVHKVAGVVMAGVLGAGLVGCGEDEPAQQVSTDEEPLAVVQAASEQTAGAETFRMSMAVDVEETASDEPCANLFPIPDMQLEGAIHVVDDQPQMELTDPATGYRAIEVDGRLYVEAEAFGETVDSPTPWIELTSDDWDAQDALTSVTDALGGFVPSEVDDTQPDTLEEVLDELQQHATSVDELGREDVRGTDATHYRIHGVDTFFEGADEDDEGGMDLDIDLPEPQVDAWISDDGYVVRLQVAVPALSGDESPIGFPGMTMTYESWDHGADITIEAPPADEVTSASELDFAVPVTLDEDVPLDCLGELFEDLPLDVDGAGVPDECMQILDAAPDATLPDLDDQPLGEALDEVFGDLDEECFGELGDAFGDLVPEECLDMLEDVTLGEAVDELTDDRAALDEEGILEACEIPLTDAEQGSTTTVP
jgi:hypothetical protein